MRISSDQHMHCHFSTDSNTDPRDMAEEACRLGLTHICFTDHHDIDNNTDGEFLVDIDRYFPALEEVREEYRGRLSVGIGIELGLMSTSGEKTSAFAKKYPFDFVIGSVHLLEGKDPYYREDFAEYSDAELFARYLEETLLAARAADGFHSLGHLDYVVRYGRRGAEDYSYKANAEVIDEILRLIIERGIALEVNAGGFKKLDFANPHPDVLRRYRELGGDFITVGSDAHNPERIASHFDELADLLTACGFRYVAVFAGGKPSFLPID